MSSQSTVQGLAFLHTNKKTSGMSPKSRANRRREHCANEKKDVAEQHTTPASTIAAQKPQKPTAFKSAFRRKAVPKNDTLKKTASRKAAAKPTAPKLLVPNVSSEIEFPSLKTRKVVPTQPRVETKSQPQVVTLTSSDTLHLSTSWADQMGEDENLDTAVSHLKSEAEKQKIASQMIEIYAVRELASPPAVTSAQTPSSSTPLIQRNTSSLRAQASELRPAHTTSAPHTSRPIIGTAPVVDSSHTFGPAASKANMSTQEPAQRTMEVNLGQLASRAVARNAVDGYHNADLS